MRHFIIFIALLELAILAVTPSLIGIAMRMLINVSDSFVFAFFFAFTLISTIAFVGLAAFIIKPHIKP